MQLESTKSTRKQLESDSHVKAESEHGSSKRRPNFTGAELEVLWQNVDVSILSHYGYIHAIELVLIYLFTYICSVRVVPLFILGHHNAS